MRLWNSVYLRNTEAGFTQGIYTNYISICEFLAEALYNSFFKNVQNDLFFGLGSWANLRSFFRNSIFFVPFTCTSFQQGIIKFSNKSHAIHIYLNTKDFAVRFLEEEVEKKMSNISRGKLNKRIFSVYLEKKAKGTKRRKE